jgi:hypothetical protein
MTKLIVTFQEPGFHCWPDAPIFYSYLRTLHRHLFHVRVEIEVTEDDREIEFINFKDYCRRAFRRLGNFTEDIVPTTLNFGPRSCETLCRDLRDNLGSHGPAIRAIEVWEDGENGSRIDF